MNIIFGALFIIVILLPGIIFRVSYLNIPYARKTFKSSFLDELLFSLIPALIIQVPCYSIVNYLIQGVNEKIIYLFLINSDKVLAERIPDLHISLFLLYILVVSTIAWWLGKWFRHYVNRRKLYFNMPIFRFYNDWHYIFTGKLLDAYNQPGEHQDVKDVWVDAMVELKDGSIYLYSGYLKQYILSPDEGLDRIYLSHVQRRKMADNEYTHGQPDAAEHAPQPAMEAFLEMEPSDDEYIEIDYSDIDLNSSELSDVKQFIGEKHYYFMPGDYLVIPYKEIKNLNITYISEKDQ